MKRARRGDIVDGALCFTIFHPTPQPPSTTIPSLFIIAPSWKFPPVIPSPSPPRQRKKIVSFDDDKKFVFERGSIDGRGTTTNPFRVIKIRRLKSDSHEERKKKKETSDGNKEGKHELVSLIRG